MPKEVINNLPNYLKSFVVEQNYDLYTPREQATWRFIMIQLKDFFAQHAHPVYLDGLKKTGIPTDSIPRISDMNIVLKEFGWQAVCVRGFIPPLIFLDFQSRKILPIAADMRTLEHMAYTPAPDIVHEAAGHAPIIADPVYREYLCNYAQIAKKAIYSKEDIEVYEAIRQLSDLKENPDATSLEISTAQEQLEKASGAVTWISEANQIARLYWWTAEYGLIGSLENPKIYGAGLLSSLEESESCLGGNVIKIPLTLEAVNQGYDITEPQPQLFVAEDFNALSKILKDFEQTSAYKLGGISGLEKAQKAKSCTTIEFSNHCSISGVLAQYSSKLHFLEWESQNLQFCFDEKEWKILKSDKNYLVPLGPWKNALLPQNLHLEDLKKLGFKKNDFIKIEFASNWTLLGFVSNYIFAKDGLSFIEFESVEVTSSNDLKLSYNAKNYILPIGASVLSVYGGPCDISAFDLAGFQKALSTPHRSSPYSEREKKLFTYYQLLREHREGGKKLVEKDLLPIIKDLEISYPQEWLLGLEIIEIGNKYNILSNEHLKNLKDFFEKTLTQTKNLKYWRKGLYKNGILL